MFGLIGAGLSLVGGLAQSSSARSAANAQVQAMNDAMDLQRETRDMTRADLAPYVEGGQQAQNALMSLYGLADAPEGFLGFQADPGYQFAVDQGQAAIEASAAGSGNLLSGSTLQALQNQRMGMADQQYGQYYNRLANLASNGMNAATGQAAANQNSANAMTGLYTNIGNAQSAGAIAQGNAWNNTLGNITGLMGYQQAQGQGLFGGGATGGKVFA